MFLILNRLRGAYGYFAKFNGVVLGLLTYFLYNNPYVSIAVSIGYILGESFGWGEWVGTLTTNRTTRPKNDSEGFNNGIAFIASKLFNPSADWRKYCTFALAIRGAYWWVPTLSPLMFIINPLYVLTAILLLSIGFPIACEIGRITANKFSFTFKNFSVVGGWEHQETIYGLMQDIIFFNTFYIFF